MAMQIFWHIPRAFCRPSSVSYYRLTSLKILFQDSIRKLNCRHASFYRALSFDENQMAHKPVPDFTGLQRSRRTFPGTGRGNQRQFSLSILTCSLKIPISPLVTEQLLGDLKMEQATAKLFEGLVNQDRASLARSITLVESSNLQKRHQAQLLLTCVLQYLKTENAKSARGVKSFRIGKVYFLMIKSGVNCFIYVK